MKIDANHLSGPCSCGGEHLLATQICVIQEGALFHLEEILSSIPVVGKRCAVYDENTYRAIPNSIHPRAEQEIILSPSGLHADENSTASVLARSGTRYSSDAGHWRGYCPRYHPLLLDGAGYSIHFYPYRRQLRWFLLQCGGHDLAWI